MLPPTSAMNGQERRRTIPMVLLGIGVSVACLTLLGWATDRPSLYTFGVAYYPNWPLSALGFALLGIGQILSFAGRRTEGVIPLGAAIVLGMAILTELIAGGFGLDGLLFPDAMARAGFPFAGRPGAISALAMAVDGGLSLLAIHQGRRADLAILAAGSAVIGLAWLSIGLLLLGAAPELVSSPLRVACSLPTAIAAICCTSAIFSYRSVSDPLGLFSPQTASGRAIRIALPVLLMFPVMLLPLERALVLHHMASGFSAGVVAIAVELAGAIALVSLGIGRIAREHDALLESEARLAHALEAHRIGLFDWVIATDRLHWSPGAEERIGVEPGTMSDFKSWSALVPSEDADQVMATIAETTAQRGERYSFRYRMRRIDGEERVIEGSARCFYDASGALERVAGVNIDITDRVRYEAEIARREAQWHSILQTVPDAMIVIDCEGTVLSFSAAAERMFGYAADDVIGRSALALLPELPPRLKAEMKSGDRIAETLRSDKEQTFVAQRSDGTQFPVEYSVGETIVDGAPIFTGFLRDVSERRAAERRFAALQLDYAHSARLNAVGELASGLAHEINQPLAAGANYLGTAEVMLDGVEGSEEAVAMIGEAGAQMIRAGEIIRRLRSFIAKTDIDMRVEPLEPTLREAVALALTGTRQEQIQVDYAIEACTHNVFADRIQVQQVVVNLVRNAAQALRLMPQDRRTIRLSARAIDAERIEIAVVDRGPGLPQEMLVQLFEPFRSTKGEAGLGIGLSICRRIVEAHGGTLHAQNLPEGGARISFTLARVPEDQQEAEAPCVTSMS